MSLIFEPVTGAPVFASANLPMRRPTIIARDGVEIADIKLRRPAVYAETDYGAVSLPMRRPAVQASDTADAVAALSLRRPQAFASVYVPPPAIFAYLPMRRPIPSATSITPLVVSADLPFPRKRIIASDVAAAAVLPMPRPSIYAVDAHDAGTVVIFQSPGFVSMLTGTPAQVIEDTIAFADSDSAQAVLALFDAIAFGVETLDIVNIPAAIAVSVAFGSNALGGVGGDLDDGVEFGDTAIALALHIATLIDGLALSATTSSSALIFGFLADSFSFDDTLDVKEQILAALADGIEFGMVLYTGEDTYTAWVMTPETRAMRSYTNYAFNSYAPFAGRLIAAKDDGVFVLEGETDDGQAIYGSVRSGLLDFGNRQLKRMDRAYLGYTADGTLGLRVATTSPGGKKVEFSYRMAKPQFAEAPRETRVKLGKGLKSVSWQFELNNNLDGGRFELHDVTVLPITLSRKVR